MGKDTTGSGDVVTKDPHQMTRWVKGGVANASATTKNPSPETPSS